MPQLNWAITKLIRRLSVTPFLIILWHLLYPWIIHVVESSTHLRHLSDRLDSGVSEVCLLLFLTFWFYQYANGCLSESELLGLSLAQMVVCATRWVALGIWNLLMAPFTGVLMWYGLKHYTEVPTSLVAITSIVLFLYSLYRGWLYPDTKVSEIRYQTRFV